MSDLARTSITHNARQIQDPAASGVLQRQCACGQHTSAGSECEACRKRREGTLQHAANNPSPLHEVPPIVHEVLRSPGQPLAVGTQAFEEPRFGRDFGQVLLHATTSTRIQPKLIINTPGDVYEQEADRVAEQVLAAPPHPAVSGVLPHIQRYAGQATNDTDTAPASVDRVLASSGRPLEPALRQDMEQRFSYDFSKICGRPSRKVPGNPITKVNLDVGANMLTIEWRDQTKIPSGSGGTHSISPGAGLCCVDCNDEKVSQTSGSLCTPKGGVWPVDSTGCALSGHPTAKNPIYFQRGGVAIHSGTPPAPAIPWLRTDVRGDLRANP